MYSKFGKKHSRSKKQKVIKHGEFDDIILCDNFQIDTSIFVSNRTRPKMTHLNNTDKVVNINYDFSSYNVSHMYFVGSLIQQPLKMYDGSVPYLKIGQWRYLSRALHRFLEIKYEQRTWPSMRKIPAHASGIVDRIRFRIKQAAGL